MTDLQFLSPLATKPMPPGAIVFLFIAPALLLVACASSPTDPRAAIGAATQAIRSADADGVSEARFPELTEARSKLLAANAAVSADHPEPADQLAREARVDAELALARSNLAKAQAVNDEISASTATLASELQRSSGARP